LPIHNQKIEAGELGVKSGKGFLDWPEGKAERVRRRRDLFILEFLKLQRTGRFDKAGLRPGKG
jgi:3-hydroxyacyl-CoA dehydrogenase